MNSEDFKKMAAQKAVEKLYGKKIVGIDQDGRPSSIPGLLLEDDNSKNRFKEAEDRSARRKDILSKVKEEAKIYDKLQ